tara:strand:- start:16 stop:198 length:183 start_codon:yes stop_codon:yes gene_type:complete
MNLSDEEDACKQVDSEDRDKASLSKQCGRHGKIITNQKWRRRKGNKPSGISKGKRKARHS